MAILGDSGVTGAGSDLRPSSPRWWSQFTRFLGLGSIPAGTSYVPPLEDFPDPERFGIFAVEPMTRVRFSERERAAAGNLAGRESNDSREFDVAEHSMGYMLGRALGMAGGDIVLVGENGTRVTAIPVQFERIFSMRTETLPPLVLMSFSIGEFCDERVFSDGLDAIRSRFAAALEKAWTDADPFLRPHALGTRIVILPPMEVVTTLTNSRLMNQKVRLAGQVEVRCWEVRESLGPDGRDMEGSVLALGRACSPVLATKSSDSARLRRLREVQEVFNAVWVDQIERLKTTYAGRNLSWFFPDALRSLRAEAGDLANDCFHPSVRGHARYADALLTTFFRRWPWQDRAGISAGPREAGK